jgi:hypothetical protein
LCTAGFTHDTFGTPAKFNNATQVGIICAIHETGGRITQLAPYLIMPALTYAVTDDIIHVYAKALVLPDSIISYVIDNTSDNPPLRNLLLDIYTRSTYSSEAVAKQLESRNAKFVKTLVKIKSKMS